MIVIEGDPEKPFFEQNPELRYFPEVKKLISIHGEAKAGYYMWATFMFEDPRSKVYKIPSDEKNDIILDNYLKEHTTNPNLVDLERIREAYPNIVLTKSQILYKQYADQIDEINVYIKALDIKKEAQKKVSLLEKVTRMWPTYEKITEKMKEEEEADTEVRKGVKESYREKRSSK